VSDEHADTREGSTDDAPRARQRRGIAPKLLYAQVENTARWALEGEVPRESWRAWLGLADELEPRWREPEALHDYLRVMLAAHFTTVATFVPTDVDAHIRHHAWQEIDTRDALERAVAIVDEAAAWDARAVSERTVAVEGVGVVAGHEGEWFSVRAGALGRALTLGIDDVVEQLISAIDRELTREAEALARTRGSGDAVAALSMVSVNAHNCGDLSRVIEAWPKGTPRRDELIARFARLGHEDRARYGGEHHLAGHVNKAVMASENHRFLALRAPRGLRRSRSLIIPIGPFFDGWGERIGASKLLEERDRGDVLAALIHGLDQGVDRWGYHRAIAGLHRTTPGGIDRLVSYVPARLRHHAQKGPVRDALRVDTDRFLARMHKAWKDALASYRP
jgi:hypothetical protein